jgi:hypothetical protein
VREILLHGSSTATVEELVRSSHATLLAKEQDASAPISTIRGKLEQLKSLHSAAGSALLDQLYELAVGYYYIGATPVDRNESELVQEGFCHLISTSPLEVQISEQRVAYALYYFFEAHNRPLTNRLIDYLGVAHKLDPSAAGFVFERYIAPKVVSWLKTSPTLGAHNYFGQCRDTLPDWSREAVVDTSEPVQIETARATGRSLLDYCLSDSSVVFVPAHSERHDAVFRLQLSDGSQVLTFCQWKFRKSMQKREVQAALRTTVPEAALQVYSAGKRKRDSATLLDNKYHMKVLACFAFHFPCVPSQ